MELEIKELKKSDYKKVIQFAIEGMHFDWYMKNKVLLNIYGRYFLYLEMLKATHIIAAYYGDELAGVLMCEMKGKKSKYHSFWKSCYVKIINFIQNTFVKDGVSVYDETNKRMLNEYKKTNEPDGELVFLAANPDIKVKGVGTFLLNELETRETGKQIYLYTDTGCTYQFYEHRGFERVGEVPISLQIGKNKADITCFLYSKVLEKDVTKS